MPTKKVVILILSVLFLGTCAYARGEVKITLYELSGNVTILLAGENSWQKATKGMTLTSGSSVKTSQDSYANLSLNTQKTNTVSIRSNSHVVLHLRKDHALTLIDGELFSSIQKLEEGSSFIVKTPLAVCGVRGTKYTVKYDPENLLTTVSVLENSVILESIKEPAKFVPIKELEERTLCPWESTIVKAAGIGFGKTLLKAKESSKEITETDYIKTYGAESLINAHRAATVDAHRNLVAKIYGIVIDSTTTLEDYANKDGAVKVKVSGMVRGAKETSVKYYSDGSLKVTADVKGIEIKETLTPITGNILGSTCLSGPSKLTFADFSQFEESLM